MIYSQKQIEKYLERIKYTKSINMDKHTLDGLQLAHLKNIPYENLDILNGIPLSLEAQALFDKIITHQRGGFCFELNGLYSNLLKSMGFKVTNFVGRFILGEDEVQTRRHRILKVEANDGTYICDVGVRGESTRACLEFVEREVQSDGISEYKLERDDFYGWILYQKEVGKQWRQIYGFTEEPQLDIDFILPCFYCEKHPDSQFTSFMKISIFTDINQISLVEDVFKVYQNAEIIKENRLTTKDEINEVLSLYFGIKDY